MASFKKGGHCHGHGQIHHGYKTMLASCFLRISPSFSFSNVRDYSQLRSKLARGTALLALASIPPSVSTLTVTTVAATAAAERSSLALALTEHATGRSVRSLLLDVGGRNDLSGEVEPFAEVIETLGGQGVVVVLPRELSLDIAAGGERLASLDNEQVLGVDIGVLGEVEVLLGDEDTLTEEVLPECQFLNNSNRSSVGGYLVDLLAVGLGNQHRGGIAR